MKTSAATVALRRASRAVKEIPNQLATESGKIVATHVRKALKQDGVTRVAGARLSVSVKTHGNVCVVSAAPRKAIGPWSMWEEGTRGHTVAARKKRDSDAMRIGDSWATGPWSVRGMRGHHTWQRGVDAARPLIEREGERLLGVAING